MIRIIAKRYAKALADLSAATKGVDAAKAELTAFAAAVEEQPAMQKLFSSPVFTPQQRREVISELSTRLGIQKDTARFLEHLAETGRIRYVREIRDAFVALLDEMQNRSSVRITTASPLAGGELNALKKELESVTGRTVEIDAKVDASVIGGVRAQIGSVVYDGTVKNQLDKMREQLVK